MSLRAERALVLLAALASRVTAAAWVVREASPIADGIYYHRLASRLADGAGYTWLWPDGVVTPAAHYPVGYPWLLSLVYRVTGATPGAAALLNTALALVGVAAIHELTRRTAGRRPALLAGLLVALDPALVLYTPALMTEGVTASLLALAALLAHVAYGKSIQRERLPWLLATGAALGLCTLIRPQCLLIAPLLGWAAGGLTPAPPSASPLPRPGEGRGVRLLASATVTAATLLVCLPWTLRNCARMGRCALVSVNGGWNLLIGAAPKATGHWAAVDVPPGCREVFDEAGKDVCFGQAARGMILENPWRWLRLVPDKLAATFDYCGAGPWYLHDAAGGVFSYDDKLRTGAFETVLHRLMLVAALVALARWPGRGGRARWALAAGGVALALVRPGWVSYGALAVLAGATWWLGRPRPFLAAALGATLGTTLLVHAVFFGAGRYSLVVFPLLSACAGALLTAHARQGDTGGHAPD